MRRAISVTFAARLVTAICLAGMVGCGSAASAPERLVVNLGFVCQAGSREIMPDPADSENPQHPWVFVGGQKLRIDELAPILLRHREALDRAMAEPAKRSDAVALPTAGQGPRTRLSPEREGRTIVIRVVPDAPAGALQDVIRRCQEAGFEDFLLDLKELGATFPEFEVLPPLPYRISMPLVSIGPQPQCLLPPMSVYLLATPDGELAGVRLGDRVLRDIRQMQDEILYFVGDFPRPSSLREEAAVAIDADPGLQARWLLAAVGAVSGFRRPDHPDQCEWLVEDIGIGASPFPYAEEELLEIPDEVMPTKSVALELPIAIESEAPISIKLLTETDDEPSEQSPESDVPIDGADTTALP